MLRIVQVILKYIYIFLERGNVRFHGHHKYKKEDVHKSKECEGNVDGRRFFPFRLADFFKPNQTGFYY